MNKPLFCVWTLKFVHFSGGLKESSVLLLQDGHGPDRQKLELIKNSREKCVIFFVSHNTVERFQFLDTFS